MVTGASSGIGLVVTRELLGAGADVVAAVRSPDKARAALAGAAGSVDVRRLDVSDLGSVRAFAESVGEVDVLINNAGVMSVLEGRSADGFELQLATNHLGHFALTNMLLPRITDRVVVTGSEAHKQGRVELDDLDLKRRGYRPYRAYAASKLANMLHLLELQRRLTEAGSRVRAIGAHPGYTATNIQVATASPVFNRIGRLGNSLLGQPPERGALCTLYAATMDIPGNSYVGPHGPFEMRGAPTLVGRSRAASDPDLARALWTASEGMTGSTWPLG